MATFSLLSLSYSYPALLGPLHLIALLDPTAEWLKKWMVSAFTFLPKNFAGWKNFTKPNIYNLSLQHGQYSRSFVLEALEKYPIIVSISLLPPLPPLPLFPNFLSSSLSNHIPPGQYSTSPLTTPWPAAWGCCSSCTEVWSPGWSVSISQPSSLWSLEACSWNRGWLLQRRTAGVPPFCLLSVSVGETALDQEGEGALPSQDKSRSVLAIITLFYHKLERNPAQKFIHKISNSYTVALWISENKHFELPPS